jgi:hypothetical protein
MSDQYEPSKYATTLGNIQAVLIGGGLSEAQIHESADEAAKLAGDVFLPVPIINELHVEHSLHEVADLILIGLLVDRYAIAAMAPGADIQKGFFPDDQ